jgi:hypothetical protein
VSTIRIDTLAWNVDMPQVLMPASLENDWTILWGTAFDHQPVFGNNPLYRGDDTTVVGYEGTWWIGTYECYDGPLRGVQPGTSQGDAARGAIRSREFVLTGLSMRLLVGGGAYPDSCYVELVESFGGEALFRETGRGTDSLDERIWDTAPYRGRPVYLRIVDDCAAPFGRINVDGIEERMERVSPPPEDDDVESPPEHPVTREREEPGRLGDAPRAPSASIRGNPNPCNPHTEISFSAIPNSRVTVIIYDVAGHVIASLPARTDAAGNGSVAWNGCDSRGGPVAAGIYLATLDRGSGVLAVTKLVLCR